MKIRFKREYHLGKTDKHAKKIYYFMMTLSYLFFEEIMQMNRFQ